MNGTRVFDGGYLVPEVFANEIMDKFYVMKRFHARVAWLLKQGRRWEAIGLIRIEAVYEPCCISYSWEDEL
jgi:hypothetical protein